MYCLNSFDSDDRNFCGISFIFYFFSSFISIGGLLHNNRFLKDNIINCSSFQVIMLSLKHYSHFQEKSIEILQSRTLWYKIRKWENSNDNQKSNTNALDLYLPIHRALVTQESSCGFNTDINAAFQVSLLLIS